MGLGPVEVVMIGAAALPIVLLVVVAGRLLAGRAPGGTAGFLEAAGLPVDDERAAAAVARFLVRSRRYRTVGTAIGVVAGGAASVSGGTVAGAMAGFLLGSVAAATAAPAGAGAGRRVAALAPRRLGDYVPARHVVAVRAVAALAVAIAAAGALLPVRGTVLSPSWGQRSAVVAAAAAVVAVTELAARRVVGRPQPATSAADVRVDDAVRAASVRAIVGAGLGLAVVAASVAAWLTGASTDVQVLRWTLPLLALGGLPAALVSWAVVAGSVPRRVQRPVGPDPVVVPAP